ncbi:MAG: leucine-rich repeat domain-containing protein [Ruminiclostridium sp.]
MFCPNCGNQVIEGKKFCMVCGEKLEGLAPAQSDNSPAPEASAQPVNVSAPAPDVSAPPVNVAAPAPEASPQPENVAAPAPDVSAPPVNVAEPAPEANPTPVSQPVYTANPAPQPQIQYQVIQQKPKSHAWIIVLVTVLVLAIAAGVTLLILKPWDSGNDSSYSDEDNDDDKDKDKDEDNKKPDSDNGGEKPTTSETRKENTPVVEPEKNKIPSTPFITVNGESIPAEILGYSYGRVDTGTDGTMVVLAGNKGNKLYGVMIGFFTDDYPEYPSADKEYSINSDGEKITVAFSYLDLADNTSVNAISWYPEKMSISELKTGAYTPKEKLELLVSGKASDDGLTFDFSAGGSLEFRAGVDLEEEVDKWAEALEDEFEASKAPKEVVIAGESYPLSTTFIDLSNKGLYNADIENIKYLTNLTRAELSGNNLSDISVLENIKSLEEIDAMDNNISDISFMKNLPNLKIVVMNNNPISDISVFSSFTTIEKIWLNDTYVTNIAPISKNKGLVELGFDNCNIKDISAIKGMNKLGMLSLNNCGVSDISALSSCTGLYFLNLSNNNITDFSPIENIYITELYHD